MKICSVPDYRGALIQVGAAVMALSWGGGRPGGHAAYCCCCWWRTVAGGPGLVAAPTRGWGHSCWCSGHTGQSSAHQRFHQTNSFWLVDCFKNSYLRRKHTHAHSKWSNIQHNKLHLKDNWMFRLSFTETSSKNTSVCVKCVKHPIKITHQSSIFQMWCPKPFVLLSNSSFI